MAWSSEASYVTYILHIVRYRYPYKKIMIYVVMYIFFLIIDLPHMYMCISIHEKPKKNHKLHVFLIYSFNFQFVRASV